MMGKLIESLSETVTKTTGGIIALPADHILIKRHKEPKQVSLRIAKTTCEQCCLCTELCPRHIIGHELPPHLIVRAVNCSDVAKPSVLSALTCSECTICTAWSCPVDISPWKLNQMLKKQFREEGGAKYVGELHECRPDGRASAGADFAADSTFGYSTVQRQSAAGRDTVSTGAGAAESAPTHWSDCYAMRGGW